MTTKEQQYFDLCYEVWDRWGVDSPKLKAHARDIAVRDPELIPIYNAFASVKLTRINIVQ